MSFLSISIFSKLKEKLFGCNLQKIHLIWRMATGVYQMKFCFGVDFSVLIPWLYGLIQSWKH